MSIFEHPWVYEVKTWQNWKHIWTDTNEQTEEIFSLGTKQTTRTRKKERRWRRYTRNKELMTQEDPNYVTKYSTSKEHKSPKNNNNLNNFVSKVQFWPKKEGTRKERPDSRLPCRRVRAGKGNNERNIHKLAIGPSSWNSMKDWPTVR